MTGHQILSLHSYLMPMNLPNRFPGRPAKLINVPTTRVLRAVHSPSTCWQGTLMVCVCTRRSQAKMWVIKDPTEITRFWEFNHQEQILAKLQHVKVQMTGVQRKIHKVHSHLKSSIHQWLSHHGPDHKSWELTSAWGSLFSTKGYTLTKLIWLMTGHQILSLHN